MAEPAHHHVHAQDDDQAPARRIVPVIPLDEEVQRKKRFKMSIGANTFSILMGLALGSWIYYYLWHAGKMPVWLGWFSSDRVGMNVAWIVALYLLFEPITSALTVFNTDRWRSAVLDIAVSIALVIEVCIALYDRSVLRLEGARLEIALLLLVVTIGMAVTGILITLIVNTRLIIPGSDHHGHDSN